MTSAEKSKLKARVQAVKSKLPASLSPWFLRKYPEYNDDEGKKLLTRVLQGQAADEDLTDKLEAFASHWEQKDK